MTPRTLPSCLSGPASCDLEKGTCGVLVVCAVQIRLSSSGNLDKLTFTAQVSNNRSDVIGLNKCVRKRIPTILQVVGTLNASTISWGLSRFIIIMFHSTII